MKNGIWIKKSVATYSHSHTRCTNSTSAEKLFILYVKGKLWLTVDQTQYGSVDVIR